MMPNICSVLSICIYLEILLIIYLSGYIEYAILCGIVGIIISTIVIFCAVSRNY